MALSYDEALGIQGKVMYLVNNPAEYRQFLAKHTKNSMLSSRPDDGEIKFPSTGERVALCQYLLIYGYPHAMSFSDATLAAIAIPKPRKPKASKK